MKLALFYDTETTGLPIWRPPSEGDEQSHIVQIAAKAVDIDTWKTVHQIELIVKPDGWKIPQDVVDIHGITTEYASRVGVPEDDMLDAFMNIWNTCDFRVGHNQPFDERMVRIAIKRIIQDSLVADNWKAGAKECTQKMGHAYGTKHSIEALKFRSHPHLADMYLHFTNRMMENAHSAMADVDACVAIYRAMIEGYPPVSEEVSDTDPPAMID